MATVVDLTLKLLSSVSIIFILYKSSHKKTHIMSSWTQVYISGLSKSINPSDEEIEDYLNKCYSLDGEHVNSNDQDEITASSNSSVSNNLMWAGPGSTLIKRDDDGCCRGFAFLTFYSMDGALLAIDRINNDIRSSSSSSDATIASSNNMRLRAELSNPTSSKKKGGGKKKKNDGGENLTDLRLRRQRKQPVRKHPVITSSDGKRTNLGNKTK